MDLIHVGSGYQLRSANQRSSMIPSIRSHTLLLLLLQESKGIAVLASFLWYPDSLNVFLEA